MKRRSKPGILLTIAAFAALVAAALALALVDLGAADSPKQASPKSTFTLEQARAFSDHPIYFAGQTVDGLSLVAVLRRTGSADHVSFIYGDCVATADVGCAPPAEVQVWPACKRHLGLYDQSLPGVPTPERATTRGVPSALFDAGERLEIHTGKSLIVVFGDSPARVERIADALRGVNVSVASAESLPQPAPGAMDGQLRC